MKRARGKQRNEGRVGTIFEDIGDALSNAFSPAHGVEDPPDAAPPGMTLQQIMDWNAQQLKDAQPVYVPPVPKRNVTVKAVKNYAFGPQPIKSAAPTDLSMWDKLSAFFKTPAGMVVGGALVLGTGTGIYYAVKKK